MPDVHEMINDYAVRNFGVDLDDAELDRVHDALIDECEDPVEDYLQPVRSGCANGFYRSRVN